MAHQLKYYKEIDSHGHLWRVEILQETEDTLTPTEIGPVLQGLRLVMQGDQADIDTPIVKTSMEMTFVDAPDLEEERKCGYWEEFYTSSATEYQVRLYKDGQIEWTGYVTPDSFSESLQYRGSVTIIARDNLGALQDFEYDATSTTSGMISLASIMSKALAAVSFPMSYKSIAIGARKFPFTPESNTPNIDSVLFNNKSFQDKTWLEAVEAALTATGLVLRYIGKNTFRLCALRDIPLYDKEFWWDVPVLDTIFCAYGQRELSPAVKTLIDEVKFEIEENFAEVTMPASAYGEAGEYEILTDSENLQEYPLIYSMPIHAVVGGSWSARPVNQSLFLNPFAFPLKEGFSSKKQGDLRDTSVVYLAANNIDGPSQTTRNAEWKTLVGPGKYRFSFKIDKPVALYDDNTKLGHIDLDMNFSRFKFSLRFVARDGSTTLEYRTSSGTWINRYTADPNSLFPNVAFPTTYEFPVLEVGTIGEIQLVITYVGVIKTLNSPSGISKGAYVPFKEFTLTDVNLENTTIPGSQKITTAYNAKNNILIQRNVEYGFNSGDVASPHIIKNGMFINKDSWYESSEEWKFNNADAENPLPVLIHQQLLAYYSKPNNVLTGELATDNPLFNALYEWNGKKHLLTSGALNIITGRVENAVLREFMRYDHMWETWVENEDIKIDYAGKFVPIRVHSNASLSKASLGYLPSWLTYYSINKAGSVYTFTLTSMSNVTGQERSAIIRIDTAYARITQSAAGDYNIDYGTDYS